MINFESMNIEDLQELIKNATNELIVRVNVNESLKITHNTVDSNENRGKFLRALDDKEYVELKGSEGYFYGDEYLAHGDYHNIYLLSERGHLCYPQFKHVRKKDKMYTVCAMVGVESGYKRKRAIAHCHPDDVFNEKIGEVVSLMKCLGVDIPYKLLNPPQPIYIEEGMVIGDMDSYPRREYIVGESYNPLDGNKGTFLDDKGILRLLSNYKILDDSDTSL